MRGCEAGPGELWPGWSRRRQECVSSPTRPLPSPCRAGRLPSEGSPYGWGANTRSSLASSLPAPTRGGRRKSRETKPPGRFAWPGPSRRRGHRGGVPSLQDGRDQAGPPQFTGSLCTAPGTWAGDSCGHQGPNTPQPSSRPRFHQSQTAPAPDLPLTSPMTSQPFPREPLLSPALLRTQLSAAGDRRAGPRPCALLLLPLSFPGHPAFTCPRLI